jgi:hypothetical protein
MSARPKDIADVKVEYGEDFEITTGSYEMDESGRWRRNERQAKYNSDAAWFSTAEPDTLAHRLHRLEERVAELEAKHR